MVVQPTCHGKMFNGKLRICLDPQNLNKAILKKIPITHRIKKNY